MIEVFVNRLIEYLKLGDDSIKGRLLLKTNNP